MWLRPLAILVAFALCGPSFARPFRVSDDIALSQFVEYGDGPVLYSPDRRLIAVHTESGRLDINRPVSTVRVYRVADIERSYASTDYLAVSPILVIERSESEQGPNIRSVRWLANSRGLAFLAKEGSGGDALFLSDVRTGRLARLSPPGVVVNGYDIQDRRRFAFTALSTELRRRLEGVASATTLTLSDEPIDMNAVLSASASLESRSEALTHSELWVARDGRPARVMKADGSPIVLHNVQHTMPLALSPDGLWVATVSPVADVPEQWEREFGPGPAAGGFRIRAGRQDLSVPALYYSTNQYILVDVQNGSVAPVVDAPTGNSAGWWNRTVIQWHPSGEYVAIANTFLPLDGAEAQSPCLIAIVPVPNGRPLCRSRVDAIAELPGLSSGDWLFDLVMRGSQLEAHFMTADGRRVRLQVADDGRLSPVSERDTRSLSISVRQDAQTPAELVASGGPATSAVTVWRPNAYLDDVDLARVTRFDWTDRRGRNWSGGLFLPPTAGQTERHPLVVQTHGFIDTQFNPSGMFSNASAAQALAAAGIVVLQVQDCPASGLEEAACQIDGYREAIAELARRGLIDPDRVGLQGFSRTSYYVLAGITNEELHIRAAILSDGITGGYMQSLMHRYILDDAMSLNGGAPFGTDLPNWLERSPTFNLHRVRAALRIEATSGLSNAVFMWEPYAILNYLQRPVEFVYYTQPGTHPLTNPRQRLASQQGAVDWFRFWLQGYEDPNASGSDQYLRWRRMRERQEVGRAPCVPSVSGNGDCLAVGIQ